MKIYNEVVTRFNDLTGKWETISEDSYEYDGPVTLAQGVNAVSSTPNSKPLNSADTITDTIKTTAGYFTNGDGTLQGNQIFTASADAGNKKYYYNITQVDDTGDSRANAEVQFSVTFGHVHGSGSDTYGDQYPDNITTLKGETQVIYNSLSHRFIHENEATGGFYISASKDGYSGVNHLGISQRDEYIWALIGKRARMKDRMNKKAWTLALSGSNKDGTAGQIYYFTDDSKNTPPVATPGGPRYNIVSGTIGNVVEPYTTNCYGWFYPEHGAMVFSGKMLANIIPGGNYITTSVTRFGSDWFEEGADSGSGFQIGLNPTATRAGLPTTASAHNALNLVNCMRNMGSATTLRLRSEEDQTQENYFCRLGAADYNFSSNPTYVSGSKNKIANEDMWGNPTTFITGVGLYNSGGQLLAIAQLSKPLKNNFASEATIKVKLTY